MHRPSRQSLHINSLRVYTLMLYGSMSSTVTLRFLRYFSSILYGCRAPVVSSNMITTTGPLVLSGFRAGVSVEGPIASVSVRLRLAGAAALEGDDGTGVSSEGCATAGVCEGALLLTSTGCTAGFTEESDGGRCFISTGLEDRAPWSLLVGREPEAVCAGTLAVEGRTSGWGVAISVVEGAVVGQQRAAVQSDCVERLGRCERNSNAQINTR